MRVLPAAVLTVVLAVSAAVRCAAQPEAPQPLPLVFEGKTLLVLYPRPDRITAQERLRIVTARLYQFAGDRSVPLSAVQVVVEANSTDVRAGDLVLLTVTDGEAMQADMSRAQLASDYASRIRTAVREYRRISSWQTLALHTVYAVLAFAALVGLILLISRLGVEGRKRAESWGFEAAQRQPQSALRFLRPYVSSFALLLETVFRWGCFILLVAIYIAWALSLYPHTAGIAQQALAQILGALRTAATNVLAYLPNAAILAVIAGLTYQAVKLNRVVFRAIEAGELSINGFHRDLSQPTAKLVRLLLIVVALVISYPYLPGSDSPAFKGMSVFLGVLLSIGSTSAVSNALAGTILIYTRAFREGDRIRIGDTAGFVVARSTFVTRVRTVKNEIITIPNSGMMAGPIVNYSAEARERGLILHTLVTIGYDAPWRTVHELLIDAAHRTGGILSTPAPFVLQKALNDAYVSYELNASTDQPDEMERIYSELHSHIQDIFSKAGVEILSPTYTVFREGTPERQRS